MTPFASPMVDAAATQALHARGAMLAGRAGDEIDALLLLLGLGPWMRGEAGWSTLHGDGTPYEVCLTAEPGRVRSRILIDPFPAEPDPGARIAAFGEVLTPALGACRAPDLAPLIRRMTAVWRDAHAPLAGYSPLGLGVGLDTPGAALYLQRGGADEAGQWRAAQAALATVLPDAGPASALIARLAPTARLASVGLEGVAPGLGRAKIYWRLDRPARLEALGLDRLADPAAAAFLRLFEPAGGFAPDTLIFSAGFDLADGAPADQKVDVCGCPACLTLTSEDWIERLDRAARLFDLAPIPAAALLEGGQAEGLLAGFGAGGRGGRRMNFYAKPAPGAAHR